MEPSTTTRRRVLAAALTITALFAAVPAEASPMGGHRDEVAKRVCKYDWRRSHRQVKLLIRCAARRWHAPGGPDKALAVARCESRYDPDAYNPAGYVGVYQQAERYWPGRAERWGFPDRSAFNGRANVIVSVRMARHAGGWDAWGCG